MTPNRVSIIYSSGGYLPSEAWTLYQPLQPGTYPLVVFLHGADGDERYSPRVVPTAARVLQEIVNRGFVILQPNYGHDAAHSGADTFGSDPSTTTVKNASSFLSAVFRGNDDPVALIGNSMGLIAAMNAHRRFPAKFPAIVGVQGAVDLDAFHADPAFTTKINTAYGGAYNPATSPNNPAEFAAGLSPGPAFLAFHDPADAVAPVSPVRTLADDLGGEIVESSPGGHTDAFWNTIDLDQLITFLHTHLT